MHHFEKFEIGNLTKASLIPTHSFLTLVERTVHLRIRMNQWAAKKKALFKQSVLRLIHANQNSREPRGFFYGTIAILNYKYSFKSLSENTVKSELRGQLLLFNEECVSSFRVFSYQIEQYEKKRDAVLHFKTRTSTILFQFRIPFLQRWRNNFTANIFCEICSKSDSLNSTVPFRYKMSRKLEAVQFLFYNLDF